MRPVYNFLKAVFEPSPHPGLKQIQRSTDRLERKENELHRMVAKMQGKRDRERNRQAKR